MAEPEPEHDERTPTVREAPGATQDRKKMQHKTTVLIILGALAVIVMIIASRSRRAAASGGTQAVYPSSAPGYTGTVAGSGTTSTDPYAESMLQQLATGVQAQQQAMSGWGANLQTITGTLQGIENRLPAVSSAGPSQPSSPSGPGPSINADPVYSGGPVSYSALPYTQGGAGYTYGNPYAPQGNIPVYGIGGPGAGIYSAVTNPAQLPGLASNLEYSPALGSFAPATPAVAPSGTQLYTRIG